MIKSAEPTIEEVNFHIALFDKYLPKIERFRPGKKEKDEVEFTEKAVPVLDDIFIIQIQLEQLQIKLKPETKLIEVENNEEIIQQPPVQNQSHFSLPQLKLNCFDGTKRSHYPRFVETFKAIFDPTSLEPKQKFLRLQTYIKGDAAELIEHLPINDQSYETAWGILNHQYKDESALIAQYYRDINDAKKCCETVRYQSNASSVQFNRS